MQPIEWVADLDPASWDGALAELGGHPLQSALWGEARRAADGIIDHRWLATSGGRPVASIRFEERRVPLLGKVAWAPRGPTGLGAAGIDDIGPDLREALRRCGFVLLVTDPWRRLDSSALAISENAGRHPQTIWIDTTLGRDRLWAELDKQWRYGVGRARRDGVSVERSRSDEAVERFFALCAAVSREKRFKLRASLPLMRHLLSGCGSAATEAQLFAARHRGRVVAGAFVLRCGRSIHYMWGATDRSCGKLRTGEALQWAVIEWAIDQGARLYDLEGIVPEANPGIYSFKKKMGGEEVVLAGWQYLPLGIRGELAARLHARFR